MNIVPDNNSELIAGLKEGNKNTYKHIYMTYYDSLCAYLLNFTNDKYIAEDLTQNILLKLWINRSNLNIHTSLKSYLYKSAYNHYIDHYRQNQLRNERLEAIRVNTLTDLLEENNEFFEQRLADLKHSIDELPEKCREVFLLNKMEGLKYQEIADQLDISIKTVENQIGKALSRLRKKLFHHKD